MTHHPHVHCVVPGGGISADGKRWISRKPNFFLPVRGLSKLFRRLMLEKLAFSGTYAPLAQRPAFTAFLAPLKKTRWFVHAKPPFGSPEHVLAYLGRYTHRVAIASSRLAAADSEVRFRWRDDLKHNRAR